MVLGAEYSVPNTESTAKILVLVPGLTAMMERVALFEGTIEFARVPGVGFTVSAAFPNVLKHSKGK